MIKSIVAIIFRSWLLFSRREFYRLQILARPVGQSLPLISTFQTLKNIKMTSMKNNSQSTASKVTSSKFSTEVEDILGVTFGSFGVVTRSKAATLGQQTLQVSSASTLVFGTSTPKGASSSTNSLEGGSSVAEKIKKTLALLEQSGSKNSTIKENCDSTCE